MNVLFGLVIVMPVISLLHTTALNLTPESGLLLLDTALCKGGDVGAYTASLVPHHTSNKNNKNNKTKEELVRAAQSYVSVVTPFDYSDMSRRLPMYRVIDVMLCGLASAFRDESFFFRRRCGSQSYECGRIGCALRSSGFRTVGHLHLIRRRFSVDCGSG